MAPNFAALSPAQPFQTIRGRAPARLLQTTALVMVLGLTAGPLAAQSVWDGNASTDWGNPANWAPVGVPDGATNVDVGDTATNPVVSAPSAAAAVEVESGGDLTVNDLLAVTGGVALTNDGGAAPGGTLTVGATGTLTTGTQLTISAHSTVENSGVIVSPVTNVGTLNSTGTLTGSVANHGSATLSGTLTGTLTTSATGTTDINGNLDMSGSLANVSNAGNLTLGSGATLTLAPGALLQTGASGNTTLEGSVIGDVTDIVGAHTTLAGGTVDGDVTANGTFDMTGNASITGGVDVTGTLTSTAGNATIDAALDIQTGSATIGDGLVAAGLTVTGGVSNSASLDIENDATLTLGAGTQLTTRDGATTTIAGTVTGSVTDQVNGAGFGTTALTGGVITGGATLDGQFSNTGTSSIGQDLSLLDDAVATVGGQLTVAGDGAGSDVGVAGALTITGGGRLIGDTGVATGGAVSVLATGTLQGAANVASGGDLTVASGGSVTGPVDLASGATGDLNGTVTGSLTNGGTLDLRGTVTGALLTEAGGDTQVDGALLTGSTVVNSGTMVVQDPATLTLSGGNVLQTRDGATTTIAGTVTGSVTDQVNGAGFGTTALTGGVITGGATLDGQFSNTGTSSIGQDLSLLDDAVATVGGQLTVAGITTNTNQLTVNGTLISRLTNAAGATTSVAGSGAVQGDVTNRGRLDLAGGAEMRGNVTTLGNGVMNVGGSVSVAGAVINGNQLNGDAPGTANRRLTADSFTNNGVVSNGGAGTGLFIISADRITLNAGSSTTGAVSLRGDIFNHTTLGYSVDDRLFGDLTNESDGRLTIAAQLNADGHAIVNRGALTVTAAGGITGDLRNEAGGTGTVAGDISGNLGNAGRLQVTADIGGSVTNSGRLDVTGQVQGALSNRGNMDMVGDVGGALANSGTLEMAGDVGGALRNSGTLDLRGNVTAEVINSGDLTMVGDTGGRLRNSGTLSYAGVIGGALVNTAAGTVTLTGTTTADRASNAGRLETRAGTTLAVSGGLANSGTLALNGRLRGDLSNTASGVATLNGDVLGRVNNAGTLTSRGDISGRLTNSGTARLQGEVGGQLRNQTSGTMMLTGDLTAGSVTNAGRLTVADGLTLTTTGSLRNARTGSFSLAGELSGAGVTNAGALQLQGGTIGGGLVSTGRVTATGNSTVAGVVRLSDGSATLAAGGQLTATNGFVIAQGAGLTSAGALEGRVTNAGTLEQAGAITGDVVNRASGTMAVTGTITGNVENSGAASLAGRVTGNVTQTAGTLQLSGDLSVGGAFSTATHMTIGTGIALDVGRYALARDTVTLVQGSLTSDNGVRNRGLLALDSSGVVTGDITGGDIVVDDGAVINGAIIGARSVSLAGVTPVGVSAAEGRGPEVLRVDRLVGSETGTTLRFDLDLSEGVAAGDHSDRIIASDGDASTDDVSGFFRLSFNNMTVGDAVQPGEDIVLIEGQIASDTRFDTSLTGLPTGTVFDFTVDTTGSGLVLQTEVDRDIVSLGGSVALSQSVIGALVNRPTSPFTVGRAVPEEKNCAPGGWARVTTGRVNASGTSTSSGANPESNISANYSGLQFGGDLSCFNGAIGGWDMAFGVIGGMNRGSGTLSTTPSGKITTALASPTSTKFDQTYLGLYTTASKGNVVADLQVRSEDTQFTLNNARIGDTSLTDAKMDTKATTISGSVSASFPIKETGWNIVPTAGFMISRSKTGTLTFDQDRTGARSTLDIDDHTMKLGFAGLSASTVKIAPSGNAARSWFVTGTYYKDFSKDLTSTFVSPSFDVEERLSSQTLGSYGEISIGMSYLKILETTDSGRAAKQFNASLRLDGRFSGSMDSAAITGQVRWQF